MGLIQWFKEEVVDTFVASGQGIEAGKEWVAQGGDPPSSEEFHRFYAGQGIESPDWRAFNRGFRRVVGYPAEEEDE